MNLTTTEIKHIIKIARDNPEMASEEIINAIIDGYIPKDGIKGFIQKITLNIRKIVNDEPILFKPTTAEIFKRTCNYHRMPIDRVKSKTRKREIIRVRQQYCFIAFLFNYSLEAIGGEIGKDHATALHHKKKAIGYCETERYYYNDIEKIILRFPEFKSILMERLMNNIKSNFNNE